jgi:hypothetical protein
MWVLFGYKEEWNYVVCRKMNETGGHHVKWNKPDSEDKYHISSHK